MSYLFHTYAPFYDRFMRLFKLDLQQELIDFIENSKAKVIADIGGGTGVLANELINLGHHVTIIDPCQKMTDIAKARNQKVSIKAISFLKEKSVCCYDIIIIRDCLHHIREQAKVIEKAYQLLKPNGQLIIQDFSPDYNQTKLLFLFERSCFEKIYPIDAEKLEILCQKNGFKTNVKHLNKRDYILVGEKNE